MTIQHADISDNDRHEAKGADTATDREVCIANGDGTTSFGVLSYNDLSDHPSAFGLVNSGFSTATSQLPSAVDTAMQVAFGAGSTSGGVTISALGAITLTTGGQYTIAADFNVCRTAAAGMANLMLRVLVNGTAVGTPVAVALDNLLYSIPVHMTTLITATAGDVVTYQLVRASSGINNGGLYKLAATTGGWADSPSAAVHVYFNLAS